MQHYYVQEIKTATPLPRCARVTFSRVRISRPKAQTQEDTDGHTCPKQALYIKDQQFCIEADSIIKQASGEQELSIEADSVKTTPTIMIGRSYPD